MSGSLALSPSDPAAAIAERVRKLTGIGGEARTLVDALDRIAELEECIAQLFDALRCADVIVPAVFRLTPTQERVLAMLITRDLVTRDNMRLAIYGFDEDAPEEKIFDVFICKIRVRLAEFDVAVATKFAVGWYMTPDQKDRLRGLIVHFGGKIGGNQHSAGRSGPYEVARS